MGLVAAALVASAVVVVPAPAQAAPRSDARWTQTTIASQHSAVKLHADILRPGNLPGDAKTPVIVSIGPYFNHAATSKTSPESYQVDGKGPSERFYDFLDLSKALTRGYTFVMVDLPGFGGSGGCTDWSGPSEQAATHDAVEWAAAQPWSTGKVGLFGKSYDGETGLMGLATRPPRAGRRGVDGAGVLRLSVPLQRRRSLLELGGHAAGVSGDPGAPRTAHRRPRLHVGERPASRLRPAQPRAGAERRPDDCVLAGARPGYRRPRVDGPAVHDAGSARGQHQAGRHVRLLQQPGRTEPGVVRSVHPRAAGGSGTRTAGCSSAAPASSTRSCASSTSTSRASSRQSSIRRSRCRT